MLCSSYVSHAQNRAGADSSSAGKPTFLISKFKLEEFPTANIKVVSPTFYTDKLSFFCDKEWKLEKSTGIPFKFRLGSVGQTDYLEGKRNAVKPSSGF